MKFKTKKSGSEKDLPHKLSSASYCEILTHKVTKWFFNFSMVKAIWDYLEHSIEINLRGAHLLKLTLLYCVLGPPL